MTTSVTCSATRWSRRASTWLVTAPQVVTVDLAFARPEPAILTQTFASRFEISTPAHRGCTTSIAISFLDMRTMGWMLIPRRAGRIRSLRLVLNGNNPRFPWEPSTTMLTYRLTGTTDESVSNRDEPNHCAHPLRTALPTLTTASNSRNRRSRRTIFARPGEPGTGLYLADLKTSSKLKVNLASRSRIRNLTGSTRSASTMLRFRACWATHAPLGLAVTPAT